MGYLRDGEPGRAGPGQSGAHQVGAQQRRASHSALRRPSHLQLRVRHFQTTDGRIPRYHVGLVKGTECLLWAFWGLLWGPSAAVSGHARYRERDLRPTHMPDQVKGPTSVRPARMVFVFFAMAMVPLGVCSEGKPAGCFFGRNAVPCCFVCDFWGACLNRVVGTVSGWVLCHCRARQIVPRHRHVSCCIAVPCRVVLFLSGNDVLWLSVCCICT